MKKINCYCTILSTFVSITLQAQITFQKTFGSSGKEAGADVIQTYDRGYVMIGKANETEDTSLYREYLIKTDTNGDTIWTKKLGFYDEIGNAIIQNADSSLLILGNTNSFVTSFTNLLTKTDKNGNVIWTVNMHNMDDILYGGGIQQTFDGGYVLTGYCYGEFAGYSYFLCKINSAGNLVWNKYYFWEGLSMTTNSITQMQDGGFLILGKTQNGLDIFILKTDALGNLLWQKEYSGTNTMTAGHIRATLDGGCIITGSTNSSGAGFMDSYLIKADSNGNITWSKTYGGILDDNGLSVQQTNDNGYIFIGNTYNGSYTSDVYLVKTDSLGNLLWSKAYGGNGADYGSAVAQTADHGFVITGGTNSYGAGDDDVFFIKTDSTGYSGCNENTITTLVNPASFITLAFSMYSQTDYFASNMIPVTETTSNVTITNLCYIAGVNELQSDNEFALYPNPVPDQITIELSEASNQAVTILIKNILGQTIKIHQLQKGNKQLEMDVNELSKGLYFVQLQSGDKIYSKKFIKN